MKRIFITLLVLLLSIPTVLGLVVGLSYYGVGEDSFPKPTVTALQQRVAPTGYTWQEPVFGGALYRSFSKTAEGEAESLGTITQPRLEVVLPEGFSGTATLLDAEGEVWAGTAGELAAYAFLDNGRYTLQLCCEKPEARREGHGSFDYQFAFDVAIEPLMHLTNEWVAQGDVLVLRLTNVGRNMQPTAQGDLGDMIFVRTAPGTVLGFLPIGHLREPGSYTLDLVVGDFDWELSLRVLDAHFTIGGATAAVRTEFYSGAEFDAAIAPLYLETGGEVLWDDVFVTPMKGEETAAFGELMRQQKNSTSFYSHTGVDIRADHGTKVVAPCSGTVLFAGQTAATGYTVVIGHGAGLNSYLYNLGTVEVETGDSVKQGERIGSIGGEKDKEDAQYTLHYEVRMGAECLNPATLEGGGSALLRAMAGRQDTQQTADAAE